MDDVREEARYPYVLDHKPGFFLSWFLYRLFKRVSFDEHMKEELKRMHREGTVVYAIKYRGQLDYLLYHYNFRRKRLPYPKIAFDLNIAALLPLTQLMRVIISQLSFFFKHGHLPNPYQSGFYKRALKEGTTCLMFLVDPKGFIRRFIHAEEDDLQFLLETQKDMDRPIFIVPQLILYKMTPERDYLSLSNIFFGFKDNPGVIRKIVLFFRYNRRAFIDFGKPMDLKAYLADQPSAKTLPDMASEIRQILIQRVDTQKRVMLGPIMKSRQEIKELVLTDQRIDKEIRAMASGDKKKLRQLRKKAGEHFEEIAADYNMTYIQAFWLTLTWFWKKIFEGVDVDVAALAEVREWARRGPLIYVPSHKSHIDYLILNYILFQHHMHIPRITAGKNLAFWPMGHIFRKSGAFFIRRSFKGAKLYSEVLARYIKALLEEGHPIEFYIEGGRSRNGKLMSPKTGFLSILLQAYHEGFCNDLIFVPTYINYDRILEEKSYLKEIGGDAKEQESLRQVLRARRLLKRRYGKIYIRFHRPFSLKEYLSQIEEQGKDTHRKLALHLVQSINAVSLVTPLSLITTAILAYHRKGFHVSELIETTGFLLAFLERYEVPIATTLADLPKAVRETLSLLTSWRLIDLLEDVEGEEEAFYYVDEDKKLELEYHKNTIIHFFIPHSFVATSLLTGPEEVRGLESIVSDYSFLMHLFKHEFVFNGNEDLREKVTGILKYFLDSAFVTRSEHNQGNKITKLGFDKLPIWASLSKTFLESYWIAIKSMTHDKNKGWKREDLLKNMNYLGRRFHKLGVIDHIGALSQLNFRNALGFINEDVVSFKELTGSDRVQAIEKLSQLGQRLYELSHYGA